MISQLRAKIQPGLRGAFFYAIYWGAVGMFEPFLNVFYLKNGLNGTQIGWMAAVLPFCYLVITPLISRLADRTRRRVPILTLTVLCFGAALTLLALPGLKVTFFVLLGIVGLVSLFRSPVNPIADSLIAGMASRHQLDYGHMRLWGSLFFTLSAMTLGVVWQVSGFVVMFLASGVCFLPVILAALLLDEPAAVSQTPPGLEPAAPKTVRKTTLDPGLLCLLGGTFLILAGLFMAGTFGAVYVTQLGGGAALVGAMMGMAALGEVPGMIFGSRIARKVGDTNMLFSAYLIVAVGLAGYTLSNSPWTLLAFAALRGIGFGAILVNTVTILNNRAPRELASTYQGILSAACWGLAPLLGGPLSGWIYQTYGPQPFFLTSAVIAVCGAGLLLPTYQLWKESSRKVEQTPAV
jgi:MFS transporter, PPP family, 3-phenylpropionic acid transporter